MPTGSGTALVGRLGRAVAVSTSTHGTVLTWLSRLGRQYVSPCGSSFVRSPTHAGAHAGDLLGERVDVADSRILHGAVDLALPESADGPTDRGSAGDRVPEHDQMGEVADGSGYSGWLSVFSSL